MPVGARCRNGRRRPCGWGATAGKFRRALGRPKAGPSLERNPWNPCQKPLEVQKKLALALSEEAQCSFKLGAKLNGASRLLLKLDDVPLAGKFLLLISLLTLLSTYMQSLENSI